MGVEITGEVLAVNTETVPAGSNDRGSWDAFESSTIQMFDEGHVQYVRVGRDFDPRHLQNIKDALNAGGPRPFARVAAFISKGRLYGTGLIELGVPEAAK